MVVVLALTGCGKKDTVAIPPPTTVAQSAVPSGWKLITAGGVSVAFPPDWTAVDVSRPDILQAVEHLGLEGQEGDQLKNQIRQFASTGLFKVMAFAPMKVGEYQSNANINVIPIPAGSDLKEVLSENKKQYEKAGKVVESGIVENPRCAMLVAESEAPSPSGAPVAFVTHVYFLVRDQEQITVSFSSTPERRAEMKKIAEQAMKTFAYAPQAPVAP